MAGHSQFKNIMHRKGAQDAKRAKRFTKLLREINVAAQLGGVDPETNPRLRTALAQGRQYNLPKENITRILAKSQEDTTTYHELQYEVVVPGQCALILEILTDNRNRTASEIRGILQKNGARLGEVSFLFDYVGCMVYPIACGDLLLEEAIALGALDVQEKGEDLWILSSKAMFIQTKEALEKTFGHSQESFLGWIPKTAIPLEESQILETEKFFQLLSDHEDVQAVYTNIDGYGPLF